MTQTNSRAYSCKNEELPVLGRYLLFSFSRDLNDFNKFSPLFGDEYVKLLEQRIAKADDVVEPKTEIAQQKVLNEKITTNINSLRDPLNRFEAYVNLSLAELPTTTDGFGIVELRKGIKAHDAEKIIKSLHTICTTAATHFDVLNRYGLKQDMIQVFNTTANNLSNDVQTLYEMTVHRRNLIQNNQSVFNDLFEQMNEIMNIGKVLYKSSNPTKLKEYTFSELTKRAGSSSRSSNTTDTASSATKE